ncbi:MAG: phosphate acyltransferase PlsX [Sedimentisphaerales bacterium]|nr:phosphate acyltransferase PlsX [Sedimentisphaerales bacterium]
MRIAIDAMGGDHAPEEIIKGALEAREVLDAEDQLQLIGVQDIVEKQLKTLGAQDGAVSIIHAEEIIGMDDPPVESLRRKRKSSIAIMARMASHDETDAVISAGNTGACVAACQLRIRNLANVNRPGIAVVLPTLGGPVTVCDVGANVSCKPINLYQYAVMSCVYSTRILGIEHPRIAIMSIGEEESKGNDLVKRTRELLRSDPSLNFIGNLEGRDIFDGSCDVVICEGFVGNVILKLTEGLVEMLFQAIKHELVIGDLRLAMEFKPIMKEIYKKYDYHEYGGALLLGINGTSVICHGSSKSRTIKNAILAAKKFYTLKINERIIQRLSSSLVKANGQ